MESIRRKEWRDGPHHRSTGEPGTFHSVYYLTSVDIPREDTEQGNTTESTLAIHEDCVPVLIHDRNAAIIPTTGNMAIIGSLL